MFHLGAHPGPEHGLANLAKATPQVNVTRVSYRHKLLSESTGDKHARSEEYQVPLKQSVHHETGRKGARPDHTHEC